MKYSVVLQDPFDYRPLWLWLGIGLLLAAAAAWFVLRYADLEKLALRRKLNPIRSLRMFFLKRSYLRKLRRIERDFRRNRIGIREAHQRISLAVRRFAQAATGKPVTSMVHSELPWLKRPPLTDLIGSLYEPEFSPQSGGDVRQMIQKSKELIRQWF